jgi:hypothetical protein
VGLLGLRSRRVLHAAALTSLVCKPLVLTVAVAAVLLAAHTRPAAGGSSSGIVGITTVGSGASEAWLVLPEEPPSCLVVFLHPAATRTPAPYIGWLDYLAGGASCAVIFPRYQVTATLTGLDGLRAGVSAAVLRLRRARFGFEAHRAAKTLRTVVVGVGLGGSLAFYYAANARRWGLPVPVAIDSIFPTPARLPGPPLPPVPPSTQVLVQVSGDGRPAERAAAAGLRAYLASHPVSRTRIRTVRSTAALKATQNATIQTTSAAVTTFWASLDALIEGHLEPSG